MSYIVERTRVEKVRVTRTEMKTLKDWLGIEFESSSGRTPEFMAFAKMYKEWFRKQCVAYGLRLISWSEGHFYCSAFVESVKTGKMAYMSFSDVRHFPGSWATNILVRTAKDGKDYSGGANNYANLETVGDRLQRLTASV